MIQLTNLETGAGTDGTPLEVDEKSISSLSADPVEASRTVVTMMNGTWFLVSESVEEIEVLIETEN
jgi:uncharacterized protein YlzI (FlbEa/FlbD family)